MSHFKNPRTSCAAGPVRVEASAERELVHLQFRRRERSLAGCLAIDYQPHVLLRRIDDRLRARAVRRRAAAAKQARGAAEPAAFDVELRERRAGERPLVDREAALVVAAIFLVGGAEARETAGIVVRHATRKIVTASSERLSLVARI